MTHSSPEAIEFVSASVETVGLWYRLKLTVDALVALSGLYIGLAASDGTNNYAGNVGKYAYIWGAQLSAGACDYQRISTTWPAEYTALAISAGYPIGLFSDRAGTTATYGPDDPVGVLLDQSEGDPLGPERVTNGPGDSTTGWSGGSSASLSSVSGQIRVTNNGSGYGYAYQSVPTTVGKTYHVKLTRWNGNAGANGYRIGVTQGGLDYASDASSSTGDVGIYITATATTLYVNLYCWSNTSTGVYAEFDNISVREIPGYRATAPSDAARPNLRLDGNGRYYFDRDTTDDNLPITWPANLTTTGVQYVADQTTTTETTGITLNGATSYTTPQRPTGDYGRVIFKAPTPNAAKVLKYLAGKAGR
jgi:hypothetical protein